ncbi:MULTISPECIES: arsenate reductase/protein-tyrosine-phosphatase family protein [unclassified Sphingobium]|uniref:arsenate reductase/protein-tyrosine-phosphatase family protein n=1 Tax=unclassified Sphingobium TaxID=2611147 RepID=UPI0007704791|nr:MULTISPECIES: low molecular weight phosphatase family protein [unclassified Sphingobium]AMK22762.1 arsenate reductase [Sphingobium sp. TKS]NML90279.1 low molecular weight phosphatase family protein [Sphingobium sp. TB-6]
MTDKIYNVLFLCTGNSARSILGEALMNKLGEGRFRAYSAGSQPKGAVHPMAIAVLEDLGFDTAGMRALHYLRNRISLFLALPLASLDEMATRRQFREIGQGDGASSKAGATE